MTKEVYMKKVFLILILTCFAFNCSFAAEPILQAASNYKSDNFSIYYAYDKQAETYYFQPLSKFAYKSLSKEGKSSYKKIKLAQKYWMKAEKQKVQYKQIDYYDKAVKLNPDLHPVTYTLASYYNSKKDYKTSNYYLNKLYPYGNIYPEYSYIGALNSFNLNDFKNTITFAKYYLSLDEKADKDVFPQLNYLIAESALSLSDYNQAITYANQIINNPNYRDSALDIKYLASFGLKKYYDALIVARELVEIYPNIPKNYFRISACSDNKQEKLNSLYKAKQLQTRASDEMVFLTDALIAKLEQGKIDIAVNNLKSFLVKPSWEKIQNDSLKMPNDTFYWSKRQDDFFSNTNTCIAKYKGNELCRCFEAVNQEQNMLSLQRQKDIEEYCITNLC